MIVSGSDNKGDRDKKGDSDKRDRDTEGCLERGGETLPDA
jgi:hypothetical protein